MNSRSSFNKGILGAAIRDSFTKLDPRTQWRNPVMFIVYIGAMLTAWFTFRDIFSGGAFAFGLQITLWLWFTVLFANFAEAVAEGRGKAQANALRSTRSQTKAKKFDSGGTTKLVDAAQLRKGDMVLVEAGDFIPGDGEIIEGMATVDESAVTGESAPVIRESGGDKSSVTGGTRVLSDWIKVQITANPGETFLDRMISLVEGAKRQKTPNEIALTILL
ncbi:MAG TPA: potassium-transporting ATPase subunit B, partial [Negativicutes bacterium]|nr:potassium-transporting ATPase subunit B [Negativicutes bacterium]